MESWKDIQRDRQTDRQGLRIDLSAIQFCNNLIRTQFVHACGSFLNRHKTASALISKDMMTAYSELCH